MNGQDGSLAVCLTALKDRPCDELQSPASLLCYCRIFYIKTRLNLSPSKLEIDVVKITKHNRRERHESVFVQNSFIIHLALWGVRH